MTAPDLSVIVEVVAEGYYERYSEGVLSLNPDATFPDWSDLNALSAHNIREAVLPVVTATLTALLPLVEAWEAEAAEFEVGAAEAFKAGHEIVGHSRTALASTCRSHALRLRMLAAPHTITTPGGTE
jgi:hypothetical protein